MERNTIGKPAPPVIHAAPPTMPPDQHSDEDRDSARRSAAAYRDYLAEREEILRHKWILSEAAGHDVGFEAALLDWVSSTRTTWRRTRSKKSADA
jgi:hypothetical protein